MAIRPHNRRWLWFFGILAVMAVVAVTIPFFYQPMEPLTRERLQAVRAQWLEKRPPSYQLEYVKQGNASGTFVVTVRKGKVESVTLKQDAEHPPLALEERLYRAHDMLGLLDDIDTLLEADLRPDAPRANNRALFAPDDGHLLRFLRSVPSTEYKLGIKVTRFEILP